MTNGRRKVAVIGGGGAAIAAALELSATPELRNSYRVTIFTAGWRLGGKAASGRALDDHARIEEHGVHVMFGFYDNVFDMLGNVYAENDRPPGAPLATLQEAFVDVDDVVFWDPWQGRRVAHRFHVPRNGLTPGDQTDVVGALGSALDWVVSGVEQVTGFDRVDRPRTGCAGRLFGWLPAPVARLLTKYVAATEHAIEHEVMRIVVDVMRHLERQAGAEAARDLAPLITELQTARDLLWKAWVERHVDDDQARFVFTSLDVVTTVGAGIIADDLLGRGVEAADGEDFRAFLHRHGALPVTVESSPLVRAFYDLVFAYEDGDISKPSLAAGQAIGSMIRITMLYKGSIMRKMTAGMGDTIFGPAYEVLTERGVDVKFFHWISDIGLAADEDLVETLSLVRQVDPVPDYPYLVDVEGLPSWPNQPDWSKIADGDRLRDMGVDLEHDANPLDRPVTVLHRGDDFDEVVLAASLASLPPMTERLAKRNPRFGAMLDHGATVATQAVQAWLGPDAEDGLGWPDGVDAIASAYVEPIDTLTDMSQVIAREAWPDGEVGTIAYFCGPYRDRPGESHTEAVDTVERSAVEMLQGDSAPFWPKAQQPGGGFDWSTLVDPEGRTGPARFAAQYWRANTRGSERYNLTPPGSIPFRLWPHESGFSNLKLAGDWTRNGIDGGSFEAAIASGRLASRAICGSPAHVAGEHGPLVDRGGRGGPPRFVDFGGLDTFPGPYDCRGTTLWAFLVKAEERALAELVRRVLTVPTRGAMEFAPLGPFVMLTWGDVAQVRPRTPPYDTYGTLDETQVAVWVPVVKVRRHGDSTVAERFWMFTSYIWVNNPMSMATGREVYGWPKSMGEISLPSDEGSDGSFGLKTYGLQFGKGERPSYLPLMEITPAGLSPHPISSGTEFGDMVRDMVAMLKTAHGHDLHMGLGAGVDLTDDALGMQTPELYLKQLRSIEDGDNAALQRLCQSRAQIEELQRWSLLDQQYELRIHQVDSHPLARSHGIHNQTLTVGYRVEMDFLQDVGEVLWDAFDQGADS